MDFSDTPEEAAFRAQARVWLDTVARPRDASSSFALSQETGEFESEFPAQRQWQQRKFDAGFGAIYFPAEVGGRGGSSVQNMLFMQEEARYEVPVTAHFMTVNRGCCSLLLKHGTEQQKRLIPASLRADLIWCQLFSEPAAGSDLAGLRTRAEKDGDDWIITGQKIWTSHAQIADWGVLIARTDASVPKHKGLTFFIVDMKSPGIEYRPIKQLTGASNFNEVFFDGLRIPDAHRVGEVNAGWKVAVAFLAGERTNIAVKELTPLIGGIVRLARSTQINGRPAIEDGEVRARLASFYIREAGVRFTMQRMLTAMSRGEEPGPEMSVGKYTSANLVQEMTAFAIDLQRAGGAVMDERLAAFGAVFQQEWFGAVIDRLGGGTDEVLKNIVAERILGLPEDVRVDKHVPFNEISR